MAELFLISPPCSLSMVEAWKTSLESGIDIKACTWLVTIYCLLKPLMGIYFEIILIKYHHLIIRHAKIWMDLSPFCGWFPPRPLIVEARRVSLESGKHLQNIHWSMWHALVSINLYKFQGNVYFIWGVNILNAVYFWRKYAHLKCSTKLHLQPQHFSGHFVL